jgi:hypothetical protein
MAFGTASEIFRAHIANIWGAGVDDFAANNIKAALFNDSIGTPNQDAALAATGYNTGVWLPAAEVTSSTDWPAGGQLLANRQINQATAAVVFLDADDRASGPAATLADVRGVLVYNDTVTGKYGISFNAFGGAQQVTAGTFTIVWAATGIARITL